MRIRKISPLLAIALIMIVAASLASAVVLTILSRQTNGNHIAILAADFKFYTDDTCTTPLTGNNIPISMTVVSQSGTAQSSSASGVIFAKYTGDSAVDATHPLLIRVSINTPIALNGIGLNI